MYSYFDKNKKGIYKAIYLLVIFQFLLWLVMLSFTRHVHELPDGRLIVHSHLTPVSQQSGQTDQPSNHTHTSSEYFYLYIVTVVNFFILISLAFGFVFPNGFKHNFNFIPTFYKRYFHLDISLRAPPSF